MYSAQAKRLITEQNISAYTAYLQQEEKSQSTIQQYTRSIRMAACYFMNQAITKEALIHWKEHLVETYAATSVNTILAAINGFLKFLCWDDLIVKALKIQKSLFCDEKRELTRNEYERLIRAANNKGNRRLSLIIQTICATGIRVSELQFITVDAVRTARAAVSNKGKHRSIFLPVKLQRLLSDYIKENQIKSGAVFVTKNGKPINRSNSWRGMKDLCESAGVDPEKVFPHNLRHLFARTYYGIEKDLSRLADILGHSNINTTRIYTMETGSVHAHQLERLGLVVT